MDVTKSEKPVGTRSLVTMASASPFAVPFPGVFVVFRVRQEMNARGLLNSSKTIQNAHQVLVTEFETSRTLITQTIIDHVKPSKRIARTVPSRPPASVFA